MRLYHSDLLRRRAGAPRPCLARPLSTGRPARPVLWRLAAGCLLLALVTACAAPQATQALMTITVSADGETLPVPLAPGSTVQQALDRAGITLNALDRSEPPPFTVLTDGASVRVVRVTEEFEVEQVVLPFERQTLRNESLPVEQEILIQRGQNGLQEITYRRVLENGVEISSQPIPVNSVIIEEPMPEIRMIGVQTPFAPVEIPGRLYYLRDGNLWEIEGSTSNRRAVVTTGDMDGRVLSFSDDGDWLLFTRRAAVEGRINELWAAYLGDPTTVDPQAEGDEVLLVDLQVDNVIHFADWAPGSNSKIFFSTVEPRPTPPGWQANNDLISLNFSPNGWTSQWATIIETNQGGTYGWWGTSYQFSPDDSQMAFARPDGVGVVDFKSGVITRTLEIAPLQTFGDWAWVPGATWGPDGNAFYTILHEPAAAAFNLAAVPLAGGGALNLTTQTGMFAYPLASPLQEVGSSGVDYQIAYLQAQFPEQSQTSRYRVVAMDRDGSNRRTLFPAEESAGLEPQQFWGAWSPGPLPDGGSLALAVIYQGNLWLVDTQTGAATQVTGDGLTTRAVWR